MVIEGHLAAGHRINESELCERLGVSRTPVREAIKTLASEGLIDLVRNKGAVVKALDPDEIVDMIEAIAVIERHASVVGVERASAAEIDAIADTHERMRLFYKSGDRLAYFKLNQAIHSALVALAGNKTLCAMHEMLQMRLRRMRYVGNEQPHYWSGALQEHELMVEALRKRNGALLSKAIDEHLEKTRERVIAFVEHQEQAAPGAVNQPTTPASRTRSTK